MAVKHVLVYIQVASLRSAKDKHKKCVLVNKRTHFSQVSKVSDYWAVFFC